jgi:FtsH-binding integral membrane protein
MTLALIRDIVISGIIGGVFSLVVSSHRGTIESMKAAAFVWGFQLLILYMILLLLAKESVDVGGFTLHAMAGMLVSFIIMGILYVIHARMIPEKVVVLGLLFFAASIYTYNKWELNRY